MDVHKNARTTPHSRGLIAQRVHAGETVAAVARGIGWEFVHVCVDDCSRVAYAEVLADEHGVSVAAFLRRAVAWFRRRGVRVERVLTDNGSGYRSRVFAAATRAQHLVHRRTRP